jgi:hypothetical protein
MFTYLPTETATTGLAVDRLQRLGVSTIHVHQTDNLADPPLSDLQVKTGGFVGARDPNDPELRIYAVQEFLGDTNFLAIDKRRAEFTAAIRRCNAVVIDCGLHVGTIQSIIDLCRKEGVSVLVHIVSSIKAENYWHAITNPRSTGDLSPRVFCISGKAKEIGRLLAISGASTEMVDQFVSNCVSLTKGLPLTPGEICKRLRARNILITPERPSDHKVRWALLSNDHFRSEFDVGEQKVKNYIGLSESTCAGFINSSARSGKLVRGPRGSDMAPLIEMSDQKTKDLYIQAVKDAAHFALLSPGATPDSVIVEKDSEPSVLPVSVRVRAFYKRRIEPWFTWGMTIYTVLVGLGIWNADRLFKIAKSVFGL